MIERPLPVGERITTRTTLIKERPLAVGELVTKKTTRTYFLKPMPVGERIVTTKTTWLKPRLLPVGEKVIIQKTYLKERPLLVTKVTRTTDLGDRPAFGSTFGSVIASPFTLAGGIVYGTGALISSPFRAMDNMGASPVAEKVIITKSSSSSYCLHKRHHALRPVGERITTVKTVRFAPVGERITTVKTMRLAPVGERIMTVKTVRLAPVGERVIRVERISYPNSWSFFGNPYW